MGHRAIPRVAIDIDALGYDQNTGWGVEFVRGILDKNPKDMPSGPVTPPPTDPNPPTDPTPPTRDARILTYTLDGPFELLWTINGASAAGAEPQLIKIVKKGKTANTAAMSKIIIPKIEFAVISTTDAVTERKRLIENANWFFKNRGLMLQANSDFADATYWGAYFFEMTIESQRSPKQNGDVMRIEAKDEAGNPIVYNWAQLKRWPLKTASKP